jgi:hypothetical protein
VALEPFGGMMRFAVTPEFDAGCVFTPDAVSGEVYHVVRNPAGGADYTPVARFFAWRPGYVEGVHAHWRVDCFVRVHLRSPEPKQLGPALAEALMRESLCTEPLWVSWHRSEELHGKAFGEVFESE